MRKLTIVLLPLCLLGCSGGGGGGNAVVAPPIGQPAPPVVNQPPTIGAVADVQVNGNGQANATVTIGDDLTAADALMLNAGADNAKLVPQDALTISTAGSQRSVAITPTVDELGVAQVSLTVTDAAGLTASTQFRVDVVAVQKSVALLAREMASADAEDEPTLLNTLDLLDDAEADDFTDLLY